MIVLGRYKRFMLNGYFYWLMIAHVGAAFSLDGAVYDG